MNPGKFEYFKNMTVRFAPDGRRRKPFREQGKVRLERLGDEDEVLQVFDLVTGEDYSAKDAQIVLTPKTG